MMTRDFISSFYTWLLHALVRLKIGKERETYPIISVKTTCACVLKWTLSFPSCPFLPSSPNLHQRRHLHSHHSFLRQELPPWFLLISLPGVSLSPPPSHLSTLRLPLSDEVHFSLSKDSSLFIDSFLPLFQETANVSYDLCTLRHFSRLFSSSISDIDLFKSPLPSSWDEENP